jgi:hypothetical protein
MKKLSYVKFAQKIAEKDQRGFEDVVKDKSTCERYQNYVMAEPKKKSDKRDKRDKDSSSKAAKSAKSAKPAKEVKFADNPPKAANRDQQIQNIIKEHQQQIMRNMNSREVPDGYTIGPHGIVTKKYNPRQPVSEALNPILGLNYYERPTTENIVKTSQERVLWQEIERSNQEMRSAVLTLVDSTVTNITADLAVTDRRGTQDINEIIRTVDNKPLSERTTQIINAIKLNPDVYRISNLNYGKLKQLSEMLINESNIGGLSISTRGNIILPVYMSIVRSWEKYTTSARIQVFEANNELRSIIRPNPRLLLTNGNIMSGKISSSNVMYFDLSLYPSLFHMRLRDVLTYVRTNRDPNSFREGLTIYINVSADFGNNLREYYRKLTYNTFKVLYLKIANHYLNIASDMSDYGNKMKDVYAQLTGDSSLVTNQLGLDIGKKIDILTGNITKDDTDTESIKAKLRLDPTVASGDPRDKRDPTDLPLKTEDQIKIESQGIDLFDLSDFDEDLMSDIDDGYILHLKNYVTETDSIKKSKYYKETSLFEVLYTIVLERNININTNLEIFKFMKKHKKNIESDIKSFSQRDSYSIFLVHGFVKITEGLLSTYSPIIFHKGFYCTINTDKQSSGFIYLNNNKGTDTKGKNIPIKNLRLGSLKSNPSVDAESIKKFFQGLEGYTIFPSTINVTDINTLGSFINKKLGAIKHLSKKV